MNKNPAIVKLLLEQETINVNAIIPSSLHKGWTALHCASSRCDLEIVNLLLNHRNIHRHALDNDKKTALAVAIQYGYPGVIELMLSHKSLALSPEVINGLSTLSDERSGTYFSLLPKDLIKMLSQYKTAYTFSQEDIQKYMNSKDPNDWWRKMNIQEALDKRTTLK